jgi:hypothetical protein
MKWKEFVREWAKKDIEVPELPLSEPLTDTETNTILAGIPQPCEPLTIEKTAKNLDKSKRTIDGRWDVIYQKLPSLQATIGGGKYITISNILSKTFYEKYTMIDPSNPPIIPSSSSENSLESPEEVVPIGSRFYMEPASVLEECREEIVRPKALLRIQAPRQRGKTSLLERIIQYADSFDYRVARVDLHSADLSTLQNLNSLSKTF